MCNLNRIICALIFWISCPLGWISARSIFRPTPNDIPRIEAMYTDNGSEVYTHIESHYEPIIFNTFDREYFLNHMLPNHKLSYRYDKHKSVKGKILSILIEGLAREIQQGQKDFTDFTILKDTNFNYTLKAGIMVLRFKKYPFVVKLSIETPESFTKPLSKGLEPLYFFYIGGGINRHLTGFTRIKNLEYVKKQLDQHPIYKDKVAFPRKWHWLPKDQVWLTVKGYNIGNNGPLETTFPAIYAVVADEINIERTFELSNAEDRKNAMGISRSVNSFLDAHINNFGDERYTGKIALIDTEHFPTVVGFREQPPGDDYFTWYSYMTKKMISDTFLRSKSTRKAVQNRGPSPLSLPQTV